MAQSEPVSEIELGFNREVILRCVDNDALRFLVLNPLMETVRFDPLTGPNNTVVVVRQLAPRIQGPEDAEWTAAVKRLYGSLSHIERTIRMRGVPEYPLRNISLAVPASELLVGATVSLGTGDAAPEPTEDGSYLNILREHIILMGNPSNRGVFKNGLNSLCAIMEFGVPNLDNVMPQDF